MSVEFARSGDPLGDADRARLERVDALVDPDEPWWRPTRERLVPFVSLSHSERAARVGMAVDEYAAYLERDARERERERFVEEPGQVPGFCERTLRDTVHAPRRR